MKHKTSNQLKKIVEKICTISRDEICCSVNNICLHLLLRKHKINDLSCIPEMKNLIVIVLFIIY